MADVYENAYITIAASWASDSNSGCYAQTRPKFKATSLKQPGLFIRTRLPRFPSPTQIMSDSEWPLLNRAWVYQERHLSTRVIHFARDQLHWECKSCYMAEDGCGGQDHKSRTKSTISMGTNLTQDLAESALAWRKVIQDYSYLSLTHDSDRLPAISAIVKRMQPTRKDDMYLAGMWKNSVLADLGWYTTTSGTWPRSDTTVPTWSWVSVRGAVRWARDDQSTLLQLIDLSFTQKGPAHFGRIQNASITVLGPTFTVTPNPSNSSDWRSNMISYNPFPMTDDPRLLLRGCKDYDYNEHSSPEPLKVLLLGQNDGSSRFDARPHLFGLVLQRVTSTQFTRIGFIFVRRDNDKPFHYSFEERQKRLTDFVASLPVKEVTIV